MFQFLEFVMVSALFVNLVVGKSVAVVSWLKGAEKSVVDKL